MTGDRCFDPAGMRQRKEKYFAFVRQRAPLSQEQEKAMTEEKPITLEQAVRQVVAGLDGPTP
ncbi:MAG: hypothetical protein N3A66_04800, partial [Planctomycetota bacterium]|nr:hypothetical protein [Planctomycetota bacterium]